VGEFSSEWLALREPADSLARSLSLTLKLADHVRRRRLLAVLDLGAGTGANLRYLAPHLPGDQDWLLVDRDASLVKLAAATRLPAIPARLQVATRVVDLCALADASIFEGRALVTASALLDLVSARWLQALAACCCGLRAAVLFAVTYDGRIRCDPEDPDDALVRELVNRHQRIDKGFGRALGPDAVEIAEQCFAALGYHTERGDSGWALTPAMSDLQRQLIEGWAKAAREQSDGVFEERIAGWHSRRVAHLADGRSHMVVGHEDFAAWPDDA
jgi:hypothetical protein